MGSLIGRSSEEAGIDTVDVHAAKHLIDSGHRYLDVRTVEEFNQGGVDVQNCLNVPYFFTTSEGRVKNPNFLEQVSSMCSMDDKIVVGCRSGVRSALATSDLLKAGFKHVSNMGGGYIAWESNGLSVKKS
ncbi:hypothetical protein RND81_06G013100 [Saponaria officinalis]|uniref:Rhodanese domain-containing protein n=1 Tax=Saponaria officinalis TaxID=3572 RepID=A0AAW1K5D3_SAPOF